METLDDSISEEKEGGTTNLICFESKAETVETAAEIICRRMLIKKMKTVSITVIRKM